MNNQEEFSFFFKLASLEDPLDMTLLPSRPNFDARIGIVCEWPDEYWVLRPLVENLPLSEFVFISADNEKSSSVLLNHFAKTASAHGLSWRLFPRTFAGGRETSLLLTPTTAERRTIQDFFEKYCLLIGANQSGILSWPSLAHKKKILIAELPKNWLGGKSGHNTLFDGIAVTGPYSQKLAEPFAPTAVVGSPRLEHLTETKGATQNQKATIENVLYVPSNFNLDLRNTLLQVIDNIPSNIHCSVFLPYFRFVSRQLWNQSLPCSNMTLQFLGEIDLGTLLAQSDCVILEDGTPLLESLVLEKPMILLDTAFAHVTRTSPDQLLKLSNTKTFGITDPTPTDIGVVVKNPENLSKALELVKTICTGPEWKERMRTFRALFVSRLPNGALSALRQFIAEIEAQDRSPESFAGRVLLHQENWKQLSKLYNERFGVQPPLGTLTQSLIRFIMKIEQQ